VEEVSKLAALSLTVLLACACQGQVDFFQPTLKTASACGLIVDRQGEAIPGAILTLTSENGKNAEVVSSDAGRFLFDQIGGVQGKLDARASGFIPASGVISKVTKPSASRCARPIYVVMGTGSDYYSYLTISHADIIRLKKNFNKGKKE
jgi:hypothetical protein